MNAVTIHSDGGRDLHPTSFSLRPNNFDLLRFLAATQVLFFHSCEHLDVQLPMLRQIVSVTNLVPGVPVFFVISGFLISASLERNHSLGKYFVNRALRIFPALWVCFGLSLVSVYAVGYDRAPSLAEGIMWVACQLSVLQFYNPDFLRDYGVGALNGSLWTIPVEISFYAILPLIYWAIRVKRGRPGNKELFAIFGVCLIGSIAWSLNRFGIEHVQLKKLVTVSVVPWLYMFLVGVLLQRNRWFVENWLEGRITAWILVFAAAQLVTWQSGMPVTGNNINPISVIVLGCLTISTAYSFKNASRILRGNDISYGLYIYHMPIVNSLIFVGLKRDTMAFFGAICSTVAVSILSWRFIENPCLRLKPMMPTTKS